MTITSAGKALARFIAAAALAVAAWPAAATTVSITPSSLDVTVGQTFSVDVRISGATDLYALQFDLGFDPGVLAAKSIVEGSFLTDGGDTLFIEGTIDNALGLISNTADLLNGPAAGLDGDGVLATITFTVLAPGASSLSLFNTIFMDSGLADLPVEVAAAARVTAAPGPNGVPEPSVTLLLALGAAALLASGRRRSAA